MDNRERITTATLPHLSRTGGGGYRNGGQPAANGNVSRGSTLERPVARAAHPGHHRVTTTAEVEHQRMPEQQQQQPQFDANQVRARERTKKTDEESSSPDLEVS